MKQKNLIKAILALHIFTLSCMFLGVIIQQTVDYVNTYKYAEMSLYLIIMGMIGIIIIFTIKYIPFKKYNEETDLFE